MPSRRARTVVVALAQLRVHYVTILIFVFHYKHLQNAPSDARSVASGQRASRRSYAAVPAIRLGSLAGRRN